jgi:hypothetical protein
MPPTDALEGRALRNRRPGAKLKKLRLIEMGGALVQGAAGSFDTL